MNSGTPSRTAQATAWLAVALTAVLLVIGTYWYGFSLDVQHASGLTYSPALVGR